MGSYSARNKTRCEFVIQNTGTDFGRRRRRRLFDVNVDTLCASNKLFF